MEALNSIVHQLRDTLKEQKLQWSERLKTGEAEVAQVKQSNNWLQSQVDHLNNQLSEAHERMKAHERDKSGLAQQVLSAEEER
jgi:chromosome segregation ATPase